MAVRSRGRRARSPLSRLDADDAFIALLIAAMEASGHVSPGEAERAHNLIWSTRRFRRRSGERVGRRIEEMKLLIAEHGAPEVLRAAAAKVPARQRPAAFALAADLALSDGRMARTEAAFLRQLATDLRLPKRLAEAVLLVIRIKNSA